MRWANGRVGRSNEICWVMGGEQQLRCRGWVGGCQWAARERKVAGSAKVFAVAL